MQTYLKTSELRRYGAKISYAPTRLDMQSLAECSQTRRHDDQHIHNTQTVTFGRAALRDTWQSTTNDCLIVYVENDVNITLAVVSSIRT
jgi:hypothetical protein